MPYCALSQSLHGIWLRSRNLAEYLSNSRVVFIEHFLECHASLVRVVFRTWGSLPMLLFYPRCLGPLEESTVDSNTLLLCGNSAFSLTVPRCLPPGASLKLHAFQKTSATSGILGFA